MVETDSESFEWELVRTAFVLTVGLFVFHAGFSLHALISGDSVEWLLLATSLSAVAATGAAYSAHQRPTAA